MRKELQTTKPAHKSLSLPQTLKHQLIVPSQPISPPVVSPDLPSQPFLERTAESIAYTVSSVEYALSPSGALRSWFKFWVLLSLYIGLPILLFTPLVSYLTVRCSFITHNLYTSSQNLYHSLFYVGVIVLVVLALFALLKSLFRS